MEGLLGVWFALALLVIVGFVPWVASAGVPRRPYELCAAVGVSFGIGSLLVSSSMRILGAIGVGYSFVTIVPAAFGLGALLAVLARVLGRADAPLEVTVAPPASWERWVAGLAVVMSSWRLLLAGSETLLRPLYGWDAFTAWVPRARVWFEHRAWVEFVVRQKWAESGSYVSRWSYYPSTTPLLQVWTALGVGSWDEPLTYAAWPTLWACLGLACYGQSRRLGATVATSAVATWVMLSVPLASTHLALAGYADLWVAAIAGFGTMLLVEAWVTGRRSAATLAAFLLLGTATVKAEGILWPAAALGALLLFRMPKRLLLGGVAVVALAVGVLFGMGGIDVELPVFGQLMISAEVIIIPGMPALPPVFHDSSGAMWLFLIVTNSFHFLWLLLAAAWIWLATRARSVEALWPPLLTVATVTLCYAGIFFFTGAYRFAENGTAVSRLALQLVPSLVFVTHQALSRATRSAAGSR